MLSQGKKERKIHPVQFDRRKMNDAGKWYSAREMEALAVIFALKKFRVYLLPSLRFKLVTDYQDLSYAFKKNSLHGKLARWIEFLAEYEFEIA